MVAYGRKRHYVTLDNPGTAVSDGDSGFTHPWVPLSPPDMYVEIKPATVRDLERVVSNTVQSMATHIITMDYRSDVNTKTRVTKGPRNADDSLPAGSREFSVTGVQNPEERNIELVLTAVEVVT